MTKLQNIQNEIAKLQKQAEEIRAKELRSTIEDIRAKMLAFGITFKDLKAAATQKPGKPGRTAGAKRTPAKASKKTAAVAAKYRGPNGETWSGRGLTPKWLAAQIAAGRSKDSFLIAS